MNIKDKWEDLSPEQKTKGKFFAVVLAILIVLIVIYYSSDKSKQDQVQPDKKDEVALEAYLLEDDVRAAAEEKANKQDEKLLAQQEQLDAMQALLASLEGKPAEPVEPEPQKEPGQKESSTYEGDDPWAQFDNGKTTAPPPPSNFYNQQNPQNQQQMQPQLVGGISMVEGIKPQKVSDNGAKKKNTIFLPPSFMKADLLVGIDAMASSAGSSNPETIVFRVNAPAVLPNELKANLSGCFIVADAFGNLAKERIQVRLQSLECLGINGHSVISETIKGFAADEDGKRDLAGIVVSRAGTNLARAAFASAIEGFGEVSAESATTSSISPLGTTQVLDTDQAAKAGLGKGIAGGAREVSKYLMELVRQTVPVIEVGAAKKVTLFIQEAVELEIRETGNEKL